MERAIRTLESFLRVRPVYHFTEHRTRAPIFLCVLGYLLENHLRPLMLQRTGRAGGPGTAARGQLNRPGVPTPLRVCTRPTPEALAVASALGYSLPARLPLSAA